MTCPPLHCSNTSFNGKAALTRGFSMLRLQAVSTGMRGATPCGAG
ncbi:MAG: hypothetical protein AVDCRST_MAG71-1808 [uncultured Lysobacter sp.]|uniref:Uncharacterized protein n=1 Tax=uncultured Lysobacter sp. TaxID=271060 RepID=A0A6J4LG09_9GAMM|nr:MAG: hypothetical protein AVDCRST_MAG71-1808 [uncultured Lysobacter sp.]